MEARSDSSGSVGLGMPTPPGHRRLPRKPPRTWVIRIHFSDLRVIESRRREGETIADAIRRILRGQ